jgi:FkbM family methyltransferase
MIARSIWRTANLYPGSAFGKVIRWPLRLIPRDATIPVLTGFVRGFRWIAGSSNATCWMGVYESEKQRAFAEMVKPGDVLFDLGSNVGFYTLLGSRLAGPAGRVVAFEPSRRNLWYLRRHLELNAITNCQVIEAAVSSQPGVAHFEISDLPVTGRITNEFSAAGYSVKTVTLDPLVREGEVPAPNVIKCDIEGGEFRALFGARETLTRYKPRILLATHGAHVHASCCELLKGLGYQLRSLERGRNLETVDELLAERA